MRTSILKILRMTFGTILVCVGLFALFTPLTPGAWLALIGLELLGLEFLIPEKIRRLWKRGKMAPKD